MLDLAPLVLWPRWFLEKILVAALDNFTCEKQILSELCWAAAGKSVIDYYYPGVCSSQFRIWKSLGKKNKQSGSPESVLRPAGAFRKLVTLEGSDAENQPDRQNEIFNEIDHAIQNNEPVVIQIQQAGGGAFNHALIAFQTDSDNQVISLKDPSRPDTDINVNISDLLMGWEVYNGYNLRCYCRRIYFTIKPFSRAICDNGVAKL